MLPCFRRPSQHMACPGHALGRYFRSLGELQQRRLETEKKVQHAGKKGRILRCGSDIARIDAGQGQKAAKLRLIRRDVGQAANGDIAGFFLGHQVGLSGWPAWRRISDFPAPQVAFVSISSILLL